MLKKLMKTACGQLYAADTLDNGLWVDIRAVDPRVHGELYKLDDYESICPDPAKLKAAVYDLCDICGKIDPRSPLYEDLTTILLSIGYKVVIRR